MKKVFSLLGMFTVSLFLLPAGLACSSQVGAFPGQEFTLPVGETAVIKGEDLSLKFIEVTGDSRCPTGVVCVWAGEATCRLRVTYQGNQSELVLTQSGGSEGTQDLLKKYTISFKLEPYPESGQEIGEKDYQLVMTVSK